MHCVPNLNEKSFIRGAALEYGLVVLCELILGLDNKKSINKIKTYIKEKDKYSTEIIKNIFLPDDLSNDKKIEDYFSNNLNIVINSIDASTKILKFSDDDYNKFIKGLEKSFRKVNKQMKSLVLNESRFRRTNILRRKKLNIISESEFLKSEYKRLWNIK